MSRQRASQGRSSGEASLEAFRRARAAEQTQRGYEVPSLADNAMAWYQWTQAARNAFEDKRVGKADRVGKRGRPEEEEEEDPLIGAIAESARAVVESGRPPSGSAIGARTIDHARKQTFPVPATGVQGMREFLPVVEVIMRLGLSGPAKSELSHYLPVVRGLAAEARKQNLVGFREGGFPSLSVLLDLVALQTVLERWGRMPPGGRRSALDAVVAVCSQVEGEASAACAEALKEKRIGDVDGPEVADQLAKVRALAASLPFAFPDECGEVLLAILPDYGPPTSRFVFPNTPTIDVDSDTNGEASDGAAEEELSVGEVLRRHQREREAANRNGGLVKGMTVTAAQRPTRSAPTHAPFLPVTGLPQRGTVRGTSHVQCCSRFHDRFADPAKHASNMCRFCATCHLMEIVFNGCKTDCAWRHWPSERRVKFHLSRYPQVRSIALDRLRRMERGEVLTPYTGQL